MPVARKFSQPGLELFRGKPGKDQLKEFALTTVSVCDCLAWSIFSATSKVKKLIMIRMMTDGTKSRIRKEKIRCRKFFSTLDLFEILCCGR